MPLTGPAGSGKTRLGIEVARRLTPEFEGAVWFVPLAELRDPDLIAEAIGDVLRLPRSAHRAPLEQVVEALSRRPSLLVLDNAEHLLCRHEPESAIPPSLHAGDAQIVTTLLEQVPALKLLITSRQRLNREGEREFVVSPLPIPEVDASLEQLMNNASVQMFVDRAQAVRPDFQVTGGTAAAVASLCRQLEGIPLAIELAAARAYVLTPAQMLSQMENALGFLVSRRSDIIPRHRTLRAAIEWSYQLLPLQMQEFFTRLSIFQGGWTLEAAQAVCLEPQALEYLEQLRERSLVVAEEAGERVRFRLLSILREYAAEQLPAEERAGLQQRHTDYFVALAEEIEPQLRGPEQQVYLDRLEQEHDNFRAVLERCVKAGEGEEGRGNRTEGERGRKNNSQISSLKSQVSLFLNLAHGINMCRECLGWAAMQRGDYATARHLLEQSLAAFREMQDQRNLALNLESLVDLHFLQQEYLPARAYLAESLALRPFLEDRYGFARCLWKMASLWLAFKQAERAVRLLGASEAVREKLETPILPVELSRYEQTAAEARSALGAEAFAGGWAEGRAMTIEQATAYAQRPTPNA